MKRWFLLAVLFCGGLAHAQSFRVKEFPGADVGTKTTNAQTACQSGMPCVLTFEAEISGFPTGSMPARCATCLWLDYRTAGAFNVNGAPAGSSPGAISAASYPIFRDTKYIMDPTFANGFNTISCAQSDCNFTAADNGKVCFGGNMTTDVSQQGSSIILPEGVLTVTGAQTATCSGGNSTGTTTNTGIFVWGHLDTAAAGAAQNASTDPMFASWADASAQCAPYVFPAGVFLIERGNWNAVVNKTACYGTDTINWNGPITTRRGYQISGAGATATILIITPNFPPTDCVAPFGTGRGCLFGAPNMNLQDLQVWGVGNGSPGAGFNNKSLIGITGNGIGENPTIQRVNIYGWGANQGGTLRCLDVGNDVAGPSISGLFMWETQIEACGGISLYNGLGAQGTATWVYGGVICCSNFSEVVVNTGDFHESGVYHGFSGGAGGNNNTLQNGYKWYADGDYFPNTGRTNLAVIVVIGAGSELHLSNSIVSATLQANAWGVWADSGGKIFLQGNTITATTAGRAVTTAGAGSSFYDLGGNTISGFTDQGSNSIIAGALSVTGTLQTSGNWGVPAGAGAGQWGTTPSVATCTGLSRLQQCTITVGSGTVGANPVLTVTFPASKAPFYVAPICSAKMTGGTAALQAFVTGSVTTSTAAFTYQGTPVASTTVIAQVSCDLP